MSGERFIKFSNKVVGDWLDFTPAPAPVARCLKMSDTLRSDVGDEDAEVSVDLTGVKLTILDEIGEP